MFLIGENMKASEIVNEMPQIIGTYEPADLNNPESNHELYLQYLRMPNKDELFSLSDDSKVYIHSKEIYCLDSSIEKITYSMEFKTASNPLLGTFVWQASVWHSKIDPVTTGLPEKVFFEYLIPTYETVLTDSRQSWDGKRFWMSVIPKAFEKGLNVYYFDFSTNQLTKIIDFTHWKSFYNQVGSKIWTTAKIGEMKRMVITSKLL